MRKIGYLLGVIAFMLPANSLQAQGSGIRVVNTFHIGGSGGWDYIALNPVTENLYVSHGMQVNVLNKTTGDSVGVILHTEGIHGIAFAPAFNRGFTSNGRANTVSVFDIKTNEVLAQIKTGDNPDAIMYDPFSKRVYVGNGHSNDLTVIDPATDKVVQTVALGGKPETAVSDEAGRLYINIEDKNELIVVNTKTYKIEHRWKTGNGEEPAGLAIDIKTKRLFVGCGNKLMVVMDAETGKVLKELPIGDGCDGVAFDSGLQLVYCANGEGTLTAINEQNANTFSVLENVATKKSARTLVADEKAHTVYLPAADFEPAPPTGGEHKRRGIVPGSFQVLMLGK